MKKWIAGIAALAATLWIVSIPEGTLSGLEFFGARKQIMFFSGFVIYVMMAWVVVLSLRLPVIERWFGGLDRVYRLHKWMGIWACIFAVMHWAMGQVPKWLVQAGVLVKPAKAGAAAGGVPAFNWIGFAEHVGEWASYVGAIIIIIALIKKIPYHWFRLSHKLLAVIFLLLTFHAVVLIPVNMWLSPAGFLGALAVAGGTIAALSSLFFVTGRTRKHHGVVERIERLPGNLMGVTCLLQGEGLKHQAGQFAFARFEGTKDPHPFTISSAGLAEKEVAFHIKALGDDTRYLLENLREGSKVVIEGPYGGFDFACDEQTKDEIWVGAGIGVTPFLARMEYLASGAQALPHPVQFFYCSQQNNALLGRVAELCAKSGVKLHVYDQTQRGPLTLSRILQDVSDKQGVRAWFCGPMILGNELERAWAVHGLAPKYFHREYFEMR